MIVQQGGFENIRYKRNLFLFILFEQHALYDYNVLARVGHRGTLPQGP